MYDNPTQETFRLAPNVGYRMQSHNIGYKFVPKTASSSIKSLLFEVEMGRAFIPPSKSMGYDKTIHRWVRENCLGDISDCKYRLLIIRDPIDRFLSAFNEKIIQKGFFSKEEVSNEHLRLFLGVPIPDINFFIENLATFLEFQYLYNHMRPLTEILGELDLSFFTHVFPIENIDKCRVFLMDLTERRCDLPHANKSKNNKKQVFLDDISETNLNFLINFFKSDYELLRNYYRPPSKLQKINLM